jgi:hypothetical protein
MKRLIILAIILVPASLHALKNMACPNGGCIISSIVQSATRSRDVATRPAELGTTPRFVATTAESADPADCDIECTIDTKAIPANAVPGASNFTLASTVRVIESDFRATPDRAAQDARHKVRRELGNWLAKSGVPRSWAIPKKLENQMIRGSKDKAFNFDYATMYKHEIQVDVSPKMRDTLVETYERELGGKRIVMVGGGLLFFLACLTAVSAYIRADEATKGYYTNQLRLAAAAGIGAAAVVAYRVLA